MRWLLRDGPETVVGRFHVLDVRGIVSHGIWEVIGRGGCGDGIGLVGRKARRSRIDPVGCDRGGGIVIEPRLRFFLGGRGCRRRIDEAEGLSRCGLLAERGTRLDGRHGGVDQLRRRWERGLAEATAIGVAAGRGGGLVAGFAIGGRFDGALGESSCWCGVRGEGELFGRWRKVGGGDDDLANVGRRRRGSAAQHATHGQAGPHQAESGAGTTSRGEGEPEVRGLRRDDEILSRRSVGHRWSLCGDAVATPVTPGARERAGGRYHNQGTLEKVNPMWSG